MAGPLTVLPKPGIDDWDTGLDLTALHIACCQLDQFLCKAPWHPEAEATDKDDEDDACPTCVDIRYKLMCPPQQPTHQHCPFRGGRRCPKS